MSRASQLLLEAYRQNKAEPGFFWSQAVKDKVKEAESLFGRAARTLDLSQVPPVELDHRRLEATLLLKEILDRVPLPPADETSGHRPDDPELECAGDRDQDRAGCRMARVPANICSRATPSICFLTFTNSVHNEPDTNGATEDFYDFFSQSPGYLLPPKWFALIEALPSWFRTEINGQAVWQWIGLVLVLVIAIAAVLAVGRLVRFRAASGTLPRPLIESVLYAGGFGRGVDLCCTRRRLSDQSYGRRQRHGRENHARDRVSRSGVGHHAICPARSPTT